MEERIEFKDSFVVNIFKNLLLHCPLYATWIDFPVTQARCLRWQRFSYVTLSTPQTNFPLDGHWRVEQFTQ